MKNKLLSILRVLATVGIFFILYKLVPYRDLAALVRRISFCPAAAAFALVFLGNVLGALRWRYLLLALGINLSLREAFYAFFSSSFFNMFFPSFVAGDAFRSFALISRFKNPQKIIFSVLMDRVSGFISLALLTAVAFTAGREFIAEKDIGAAVLFMLLAAGLVLAIIFRPAFLSWLGRVFSTKPKVREKIEAFHREFPLIRRKPRIFFTLVFGFSLPIQVLTCVSFYFLARSLSLQLGLEPFFLLVPISMMIAFLPLTVAGIGTRELALVYLFSKVGVASTVGLAMGLLNLLSMILVCLSGGVVYVAVYHRWLERSPQGG